VAALSSAMILFTMAILLFVGNGLSRSRSFYAAKACLMVLVMAVFVPSLFAKAEGFAVGSAGYAYEDLASQADATSHAQPDELGVGPVAALRRLIMRSTVVQSYREGNLARLSLYAALFASAWAYLFWAVFNRQWHPLIVALIILSSGVFLEGLALWSIAMPLMWVYTQVGIKVSSRSISWKVKRSV